MWFDRSTLRPLRDYQADLKAKLDEKLASGSKRIMIQGPCGFGKTLTAAHIIADFVEKGQRVCFVAPRLTLIDQSVKAFEDEGFGMSIGVIQGSHAMTDYDAMVQVASLQTLTRRKLPEINAFIVDEAHMTSNAFLTLVERYKGIPFIGLSATPWRAGLGRTYDSLIVAETTQGLINRGFLTPFKTFAPAPPIDLSKVKVLSTGDYNQGQLAEAVNKKEIVGDIVRHWLKLGEDRQTICFCVDREHAKHVQQRFLEAGVAAGYVDCFTEDKDRQKLISDFRNGDIRVICNVGVLTTGFDAPEASCMIDAAPTRSLILHVQKTGRVLRTAPGKENALILDHAGNTLSLGIVTDITRTDMCDGSADSRAKRKELEKQDPKPRLCPECKTVVGHHRDDCPECGHVFKRFSTVIASDGYLVERGKPSAGSPAGDIVKDQRIAFYGELRAYGFNKGYKEGWAANQYKNRFGSWPNDPAVRYAPPMPPTLETLNWIKAQQIAWSRSQLRG